MKALWRGLSWLFCLGFAGIAAHAQNLLYVEHRGQMYPVRKANDYEAYVRYEGKLVRANGQRFSLHQADEYYPVLIEVKDIKVRGSSLESIDDGSSVNSQFELRAEFSTAYDLRDVFLALELHLANGKKFIYVREIGHLEPHKTRWLKVDAPLASSFEHGTFRLHLFVGGEEVLTTQQSAAERGKILDAMIAKRVANVREAAPQPFFGPPPDYPAKFLAAKTKGRAVVRLHILQNGAIDRVLPIEATDPAFGESAVAAMQQWRFLPKMVGGQPVETEAEMPLDFAPPEKS